MRSSSLKTGGCLYTTLSVRRIIFSVRMYFDQLMLGKRANEKFSSLKCLKVQEFEQLNVLVGFILHSRSSTWDQSEKEIYAKCVFC